MAVQNRIDSNSVGLRIAEEDTDCIGQLASETTTDNASTWKAYAPNEFGDFGPNVGTVSRRPLEPGRQRRKGSAVSVEAAGTFTIDLTQNNLTELMKGALVTNIEEPQVNAAAITDVSSGVLTSADIDDDFEVGDLLWGTGSSVDDQNALFRVTATASNTITVTPAPADDASPDATWQLQRIGFRFTAGDLDVDASGTLPQLTTSTKTLTELDINSGDWIFVGGDAADTKFTNQATTDIDDNNGFMRVRSIAANAIEIDQTDVTMTTEASTTETIEIYFGRVIHNQALEANQQRHTYQLERTLGEDASGTQAEYLKGAVIDNMTFNFPLKDKATVEVSFTALDHEVIDGDGSPAIKSEQSSASTEALLGEEPFNTATDIAYRMAVFAEGTEAPTPLFAYLETLNVSIANNVSRVDALGTLGSIDMSYGGLDIGAEPLAIFEDVDALDTIRAVSDVCLNWRLVKQNAGIHFDLPLMTASSPGADVSPDTPIKLPMTGEAATGASLDATALDHTMKISIFPYLPTLAAVS